MTLPVHRLILSLQKRRIQKIRNSLRTRREDLTGAVLCLRFKHVPGANERTDHGRGGAFRVVGRAVLKDYELRFSKASAREAPVGFANVVKKPGSVVEGILYEVDEKGMSLLDAFEGVPDRHYQREILPVETPGGLKAEACVYVACPERVREGLKPAGSYLALLLEGRAFLSQEYVRWLEAQPVQEGDQIGGSDDPS